MSINRIDFPTTPNPIAGDWSKLIALLEKAFRNLSNPVQVVGSNVPEGATFQIGGVIYYTDADTAISGTASDYVKLTPNVGDSGATVDASFVSSLTGVTWNKLYNGYYDVDGNMYLFNELKALVDGEIASINTRFVEQESDGTINLLLSDSYLLNSGSIDIDADGFLVVV